MRQRRRPLALIIVCSALACTGGCEREFAGRLAPATDAAISAEGLDAIAALCGDSSTADYLRIAPRLPAGARAHPPRALSEVAAEIESLPATPAVAEPLGERALAAAIEHALGIGALRAELATRHIEVSEGAAGSGPALERGLVFHDPWVGRFEGILLLPRGAGPFPAVLALHGHGDSAELYRDLHRARDYPAHGIAILMLRFRAMEVDACEHELSRALLAQGLSLMGMRVYEALVALRYLAQRPDIDAARLGLIGHSGGSSTGNLVIHLAPELRAYVSDHRVDYRHLVWYERWHCETLPGLIALAPQIDDLARAPVPSWRVPYGFGRRRWFGRDARETAQLLDFFAARLAPGTPPGDDRVTHGGRGGGT